MTRTNNLFALALSIITSTTLFAYAILPASPGIIA